MIVENEDGSVELWVVEMRKEQCVVLKKVVRDKREAVKGEQYKVHSFRVKEEKLIAFITRSKVQYFKISRNLSLLDLSFTVPLQSTKLNPSSPILSDCLPLAASATLAISHSSTLFLLPSTQN